jgi:enediyne biosynthesis protein E4
MVAARWGVVASDDRPRMGGLQNARRTGLPAARMMDAAPRRWRNGTTAQMPLGWHGRMVLRDPCWVSCLALLGLGCNDATAPHTPMGSDEGTSTGVAATLDGGSTHGDPDRTPTTDDDPARPRPDLGGPQAPPVLPRFVDVTVEAGLDVDPGDFAIAPFCILDGIDGPSVGSYCIPERFLGSAAVGDFDGDDWPDVYMSRIDGPGRLMRNRGDGTFEDVAEPAGILPPSPVGGSAWIDVEGDGDLDLMITAFGDTRHYLYVNDGAGYFSEQARERGVALATGLVHVGMGIAVGDYDLDGYPDLFVADWRASNSLGLAADHNRLLHNRGAAAPGCFEDVTEAMGIDLQRVPTTASASPGAYGFAPAFVDLDGDGWPELALAADFGTSRLYWNDGAGRLHDGTAAARVGLETNGMGSTFGDYDGDGDLDWFVSAIWTPNSLSDGNRMYRNDGDRTFTNVTDALGVRYGGWGWGTAMFDADHDGDLDLALAAGWPSTPYAADPLRLWLDDGPGPWPDVAEQVGLSFARQGRGLVPFDYDRDGDLDLLVMANTEIPALFRNDVEGGSWLEVRAVGHGPDRSSLGARVRVQVEAGGAWQVRQLGVGSHFFGQAEAVAHFGLGEGHAPVHRVEVTWPASGRQRVREGVARDQRLVLGP